MRLIGRPWNVVDQIVLDFFGSNQHIVFAEDRKEGFFELLEFFPGREIRLPIDQSHHAGQGADCAAKDLIGEGCIVGTCLLGTEFDSEIIDYILTGCEVGRGQSELQPGLEEFRHVLLDESLSYRMRHEIRECSKLGLRVDWEILPVDPLRYVDEGMGCQCE